jgi:hypothetical protein
MESNGLDWVSLACISSVSAELWRKNVDCGNENHVHTAFNNGTSTNFFIGNCPMQDGGILITVTASAKGFADSTSEVFVYNKVLAEIEHLVYDTEKDQIVWNAVAGTADYRVKVTVAGNTYTFHNGTSTVFSLAGFTGDISVSVIPVTDGYNSPAEAVVTCKKTAPAAPAGVNITGMVISWEPVEGAVSYEVVIGDKTISTSTNRLNLADAALTLTQGQFYTVKVKAINANNEGSSYSEEMETGYFAMNPHLRYEQNTVYWMPVLGVENYQVRVNGANTQNVSAMTSASVTLTREGENIIEVRYVSGEATSDWVSLNVMAYAVEYDTRSVAYGAFYIEYLAVGDRMSLPTEGFSYDGMNLPVGTTPPRALPAMENCIPKAPCSPAMPILWCMRIGLPRTTASPWIPRVSILPTLKTDIKKSSHIPNILHCRYRTQATWAFTSSQAGLPLLPAPAFRSPMAWAIPCSPTMFPEI